MTFDDWVPVDLVRHDDVPGRRLRVPHGAIAGFTEKEFPPLLIRLPDRPAEVVLVSAEWIEAVPGQTGVRASEQLLTGLSAPAQSSILAQVRRANAFQRIRHDRATRRYVILTILGVLAGAWELVAAILGEHTWANIVAAGIVLVSLVLGGVWKTRVEG